MKRLFLFLITNILVMVTISVFVNVLGLNKYMTPYGINYQRLSIFCLVWGFAGSFISLLMSKSVAKKYYDLTMINSYTTEPQARKLYTMVETMAKRAGIKTPEVGYYESPEMNAFATGWNKNSSLVAVSTGLFNQMDESSVEAVIGHEVSHIANGDMVTLTLIQGVVNSFSMFLSRVLAQMVGAFVSSDREKRSYALEFGLQILFEIVLTILGTIVVMWFSRWREYRADAGGANLTTKNQMINALKSLTQSPVILEDKKLGAMKILGSEKFLSLFSSHPPIASRIKALEKLS